MVLICHGVDEVQCTNSYRYVVGLRCVYYVYYKVDVRLCSRGIVPRVHPQRQQSVHMLIKSFPWNKSSRDNVNRWQDGQEVKLGKKYEENIHLSTA